MFCPFPNYWYFSFTKRRESSADSDTLVVLYYILTQGAHIFSENIFKTFFRPIKEHLLGNLRPIDNLSITRSIPNSKSKFCPVFFVFLSHSFRVSGEIQFRRPVSKMKKIKTFLMP